MAKMAPVHPGNGVLHWGDRIEIPNPTDAVEEVLAVPVTLLRGNSDLVVDRLRQAVINRGNKTTRYRLTHLDEGKTPDSPPDAGWIAWVIAEPQPTN